MSQSRTKDQIVSKKLWKKVVFCIILILLSTSTGFGLGNLYQKTKSIEAINSAEITEFTSEFPFLDPARVFTDKKHVFTNLAPLREKLSELLYDNYNLNTAVYLEFLNTGSSVALNHDTKIWPASLSKLPIAIAVAKKLETESWLPQNKLVVLEQDKNDDAGTLFNYALGSTLTIEQLLHDLLVNSDNTAFNMFVRNLELTDIQAVEDGVGVNHLLDDEGKMTAKDYSRILRSLYTASYLNKVWSNKLLELLEQSAHDSFLKAGLPTDVKFAHKYAENVSIFTYVDAGIVYASARPYILTIMIQGSKTEDFTQAKKLMEEASKITYEYISQYQK